MMKGKMSAEAERLNREYAELVERQERGEIVRVEILWREYRKRFPDPQED